MTSPPTGTVTFLFTDLVGSTALWEQNPRLMEDALAWHDQVLRRAIDAHDGYVLPPLATGSPGCVHVRRSDKASRGRFDG